MLLDITYAHPNVFISHRACEKKKNAMHQYAATKQTE